jgi:hypothetical protein
VGAGTFLSGEIQVRKPRRSVSCAFFNPALSAAAAKLLLARVCTRMQSPKMTAGAKLFSAEKVRTSIVRRSPVWRDLKAHHLAHQTFKDIDALDQAIHAAVHARNQQRQPHSLAKQRSSA